MKVAEAAYIVQIDDDESESEDGGVQQIWMDLYPIKNLTDDIDADSDVSSEMSDDSDRSMSPVLDDTKCRC